MAQRKATDALSELDLDLYSLGARVISVFGAFDSRVLVEMPTRVAEAVFPGELRDSAQTNMVEAVERDVAAIRCYAPELANSALAAAAFALAYEISHPYNSATSKSMCARELRDTLDRLRQLAPKAEEKDDLDDLAARRARRRNGGSAA